MSENLRAEKYLILSLIFNHRKSYPAESSFHTTFFWYSFETMSDNFYSNTYIQFCAPFFFEKKNIDREAKCSVASEQ